MATKYLIIEDEMAAYHLLSGQLRELRPDAEIEGPLQTIDEAVEYFQNNPMPDIAFMDIHLADGSSFAIYDNVEVSCPVVFTTAYEEYALKAFEVNCIDYLLKPIDRKKLEHALGKHELLSPEKISNVKRDIEKESSTRHNTCLLIHQRDKIIPVPTSEIAIIYLADQMIKLKTFKGETFYLNMTLEDTYSKLDPSKFYRANRQQIIARGAIKEMSAWFGHKLLINLTIPTEQRIIVSKTKASEFKTWVTQN